MIDMYHVALGAILGAVLVCAPGVIAWQSYEGREIKVLQRQIRMLEDELIAADAHIIDLETRLSAAARCEAAEGDKTDGDQRFGLWGVLP